MSNQAVVVTRPGHAEILNVAYPTLPGDDWIIVKTNAVAINPSDYQHVDMLEPHDCTGCTVGVDYAGIVVSVGSTVTSLKPGDRVMGGVNGCNVMRKTEGSFAQYIAAKAALQNKTPDNISDIEAATQGVALATICLGLYRDLEFPPLPATAATTLFIYGGSTAMGIAAIQFARLSGATVITTASPANADYVKSLGADHVFDYNSPTLIEDVKALHSDSAFDCYPSEASVTVCTQVLARGIIATLGPGLDNTISQIRPDLTARATVGYTGQGEPFYLFGEWPAVPEDHERVVSFLPKGIDLVANGVIKAPRVFVNRGGSGLRGILHGLSESRDGKVSGGKLVYTL
jgi:NADPH:quinone reductase-like Zn-dependent oxidoreductase